MIEGCISLLLMMISLAFGQDFSGWSTRTSSSPKLPDAFHSRMIATRQDLLSIVDVYYDFLSERGFTSITDQQSGVTTYAIERGNETTYVYDDTGEECDVVRTHVRGILRPDFLAGASYAGDSMVHGFPCECWLVGRVPPPAASSSSPLRPSRRPPLKNSKGVPPPLPPASSLPPPADTKRPRWFLTYCNRRDTSAREPVRITFFDGTTYDVMAFKAGLNRTAESEKIEIDIPLRCFNNTGNRPHTTIIDTMANTRLLLGPLAAGMEYERRMSLDQNLKRKKVRSRVVVSRRSKRGGGGGDGRPVTRGD